jgi:hypothetical protein
MSNKAGMYGVKRIVLGVEWWYGRMPSVALTKLRAGEPRCVM